MTITSEGQNVMLNEAKMASLIGEYISEFQPEDIEGDDIDLRFEVDGIDTGCDVSIVEQFGKTAAVIDKLLAHIDAQTARIAELESASPSALKEKLRSAESRISELEEKNALANGSIESSLQLKIRADAAEKELAALADIAGSNAARVKELERELATSEPFGWLRVVSGRSFQIMEGGQRPPDRSGDCVGPWFAVYTQPVPVAVPDTKPIPDVYMATYHENIGWNACIDEVLRLNSGSMSDEH